MPRCPSCHRRLVAGAVCPADGGEAVAVSASPAVDAPALPGVTVDAWLGGGGQADVWAAADGAQVVKLARLADEATVVRFAAEAAALRRVGPPAVPALLALGALADGRPFLRLARAPGETLADRLGRAAGPPALAEVERIGGALLEGAAAVHAAGLVHGDFKPTNVIIGDGDAGVVTWIDLGLAAEIGAALPQAGGSPEQLAPERWDGAPPSPASDVYALGATIFELITLRAPFAGERAVQSWAHRLWRPPPATGVPEAVAACVARALAKRPDERPADAPALRAAWHAAWATAAAAPAVARPGAAAPVARQPAILVLVEAAPAGVVDAWASDAAAIVAWEAGASALLVFPAAFGRDPAARALRLADDVVAAGGRVALRLGNVELRRRASGRWVAHGAALDAAWRPAGAWQGLVIEPALARLIGRAGLAPEAALARPPLVGRDELLGAVRVALERHRAGAPPSIFLVTGAGAGSGKSRAAEALAEVVRERWPGAAVVAPPALAAEGVGLPALDGADVVVIDDAQHADVAALAALERAAGDEGRARAFVVVVADDELLLRHPDFGARVGAVTRHVLAPLGEADARVVAATLLAPADYVPEAVLARLADWSAGRPAHLVAACAWLRHEGALRQRPGGSWFVDAARLAELPPAAGAPWLAARALARLPDELATLARRAAIAGAPFERATLDALGAALDGGHAPSADAGAGLALLEREALVRAHDARRWSFTSPGIEAAVRELAAPLERARVHTAALAVARAASDVAGVARHAEALGERAEAAAAHLEVARQADAACDDVTAERHAAAAEALGAGREALERRGRARWRLHRFAEGLADLRAAAEAAPTPAARAATLLELATALDWAGDYAAAEVTAGAAALAPSGLGARVALAAARVAWRRGEADEAARRCAEAEALAAAAGDDETRTVALLLGATALATRGALDDAEARFAAALALTVARSDRLHRSALYANRLFLWSARRRFDRAKADLRAAMALAREIGQPLPERVATYNLAELTYFEGSDARAALTLARRAHGLAARFLDAPVPDDALLLARVHLDAGDVGAARACLAEAVAAGLPAGGAAELHAALVAALVVGDVPPATLVAEATARLPGDEALDFHYWRARAALAARDTATAAATLAGATALVAEWTLWQARFAALAARAAAATAPRPG